VTWSQLGLAPGAATIRDLWLRADLPPATDGYQANVPAHGVVFLKIAGTETAPPSGTRYLSDLPWLTAANSYGPAERDLSNGGLGAKDGKPLSIGGKHYDKGIGAHAASLISYRLAGACTSFTADMGIDDEADTRGSAVFQVWADGVKLFDSGLMQGKMAARTANVDVSGKSELWLFVDNGGNDRHQDHVDWADAEITCK
jgi:alpha-galactosidase